MNRNESKRLAVDAKVDSIIRKFSSFDLQSWSSAKVNCDQTEIVFRNRKLFEKELSVCDAGNRQNDEMSCGWRKSTVDSEKMRKTGNDLFAKSRFVESIKKYSEAIRHAPVNSRHLEMARDNEFNPREDTGNRKSNQEQTGSSTRDSLTRTDGLSLAFSNRSAALFHVKRYREAIQDINCALFFDYPMETRYKLYERRSRSWLQLGRHREAEADAVEALSLVRANVVDETSRNKLTRNLESLRQLCQKTRKETNSVTSTKNTGINDCNSSEQSEISVISKEDSGKSTVNSKAKKKKKNGQKNSLETVESSGVSCNSIRDSPEDLSSELKTPGLPSDPDSCSFFDSIEVRRSELCGRYTVAKQDIRVGKVVAMETPYSSVLYPDCYDTHCYSCFRETVLPFPCLNCSDVVYCSVDCWRSAWKGYHWAECGWMDRLAFDWVGRIGHLAYRILLDAGIENVRRTFGSELENSNDKMEDLDRLNNESEKTEVPQRETATGEVPVSSPAFQNGSRNVEVYGKNEDEAAYGDLVGNLVRHEAERTPTDNLELCAIAFVLFQISKVTGWLPDLSGQEKSDAKRCADLEKIVFSALLFHLQMIQCNAFEITEMRSIGESSESSNQSLNLLQRHRISCIGLGIYPALATMNHSCDPNVDLVFYGNKTMIRAVRNIEKSEEVNVDYGHLFPFHEKSRRLQSLRSSYFFDCTCKACVEDWPLWADLPASDLTLKCSRCRSPFKAATVKECPGCKNDLGIELMDAVKRLEDSQRRYSTAMQNLAPGLEQATAEVVEDYLTSMQNLICLPWKDFYSCQATLRQLYRIMANKSLAKL